MAVRPLRPATDRRLGEPLPHQQANRTQVPQQAPGPEGSPALITTRPRVGYYAVLAFLSEGCPPLEGRSPTRYSPVCHSTCHPKVAFAFDLHVLGTPPALILSQDQTLKLKTYDLSYPEEQPKCNFQHESQLALALHDFVVRLILDVFPRLNVLSSFQRTLPRTGTAGPHPVKSL